MFCYPDPITEPEVATNGPFRNRLIGHDLKITYQSDTIVFLFLG